MLSLTSPAVKPNQPIPGRYTCDGEDVSPPLAWLGLPAGTQSLALMIEDADAADPAAPQTRWAYWIVYNIPATVHALAEDAARRGLPVGALTGTNDWGRTGYGGPCPPTGRHRYIHRLYALNRVLPDLRAPRRAGLEAAMRAHILGEATLTGTYIRERKARRR
ncbi:MAG TPA: YbhB/YbcL family Raf kinase inhibitor-like protein [Steroidobacteraceae bacterium]|nr:YbhB/YbcL family Raf kinase inhibitor-like protein [Steroidobacteraceae bacterium]